MLKNVKYLKTTNSLDQMPKDDQPEIVIIGRSNVGKSTFINALADNKKLAKTSSVPGKTRAISFFAVDNKFRIVDIPGYGYAKISKRQILDFQKMIENYLKHRTNLKQAILLLDIRRGIQDDDLVMLNYLAFYEIPFMILGTKKDKAKQGEVFAFKATIKKELNIVPFLFSAFNKSELEKIIEMFQNFYE